VARDERIQRPDWLATTLKGCADRPILHGRTLIKGSNLERQQKLAQGTMGIDRPIALACSEGEFAQGNRRNAHLPDRFSTQLLQCAWVLLDDCDAGIGVQHPFHSRASLSSASEGCSRFVMKSCGNLSRLCNKGSHDLAFGNNTTALPARLMKTSFPSNRNSLGRRTAWLSPFLNSFAVFMGASSNIYWTIY